ncbi:MAG: peptidase M49 [Planctomycetota bacterium]|nr:peptidase M49 [Planctomycetota bacterium]
MKHRALALAFVGVLGACQSAPTATSTPERKFLLERVDDVAIVRVYADGFERLTPRERALSWHLYQAAVAGRTIYFRQRCADGPELLQLFEELYTHSGSIGTRAQEEIRRYTKLLWVHSSPYHNTTARKFCLRLKPSELADAADAARLSGAKLPLREGESVRGLVERLGPLLFDPEHEPMVTAKSGVGGLDIVQASAANFYGPGVSMRRLEGFEEQYSLNSNVELGPDDKLVERPWRIGLPAEGVEPGMYAEELTKVVEHLEAALPLAPEATRRALEAQIRFYRTGKREDRVAYDIAWVADTTSPVDTVNSFVEVYVDPRGRKGAWEGIVSYEDPRKAEQLRTIAANAQWFEDHMPYAAEYRKPDVVGISARSIDVIVETGDSGPVTPIGINLPNDAWVRENHGSKSVSLANVIEAQERSASPSARAEFTWDSAELARAERWQAATHELLVALHEVIGHASGRQSPERQGDPAEWIREHYSTLEEARSDLVALWFMGDPKLQELGLLSDVSEASLACYEQYVRNGGLQQLRRAPEGERLEEDHLRNRQLIVRWIEHRHPEALKQVVREGRTFLRVLDARSFRAACGELLALVQQIKSTGDYEGAKELIERYGVEFDPRLRDEIVARYARLDVPALSAFVFPKLEAVRDAQGNVVDAKLSYPASLEAQMLEWSGRR